MQEIFAVQVVPNIRFWTLSTTTTPSSPILFVLPDEARAVPEALRFPVEKK